MRRGPGGFPVSAHAVAGAAGGGPPASPFRRGFPSEPADIGLSAQELFGNQPHILAMKTGGAFTAGAVETGFRSAWGGRIAADRMCGLLRPASQRTRRRVAPRRTRGPVEKKQAFFSAAPAVTLTHGKLGFAPVTRAGQSSFCPFSQPEKGGGRQQYG